MHIVTGIDRLETYKNFYQKEVERRHQLNNDLSIPIGLISILFTGIFFYLSNFDFTINKNINVFFVLFLSIGVFYVLKSVYRLLKSYLLLTRIDEYKYLAYPNEIEEYFQSCLKYHLDLKETRENAIIKASEMLKEYFIDGYIRTATINMAINDERSTNLYRCKRAILYSLISLFCCFIPYMISFYSKDKVKVNVEIVNPIKIVK